MCILKHISNILIQGAMDTEIECLLNMCQPMKETKIYDHIFFTGSIGDKKIIISKT